MSLLADLGRAVGADHLITDPVARRLLGSQGAPSLRGRELAIDQAYRSGQWDAIKAQVPLRQGRTLDFPDGSRVKVESIHAVTGSMGMMTA